MKQLTGERYAALEQALEGFLAGALTREALKAVSAPLGIYPQRNGAFMVRVRVSGGEIACDRLAGLADLLSAAGGYAHLTSRQDIQLHDIPVARVKEAVWACDRLGLPFHGGGGNTYRNILVGEDSGLSSAAVFDVFPYAHAINRAVQSCEKAFALPRKFKIGLFASERDRLRAAVQDVGFLAQRRAGQEGFAVYAAGGMGRDSSAGVELFDFLPAQQAPRAVLALLDLFYDHGDRTNRQQARLRYVLKRLGAEAFKKLCLEYFERTPAPAVDVPADDRWARWARELPQGPEAAPADGFAAWERVAALPTRFSDDVRSVRLYVPYGNLRAAQLRAIASCAVAAGSPVMRLLATQDLLIPLVRRAALPHLHRRLLHELPDLDLTFASYRGHLVACVGASVCTIGMVDSPAVADRVAAELDAYLPADTPARLALLRLVTDDLRISGCPNSCAAHPSARFGLGCSNQKVDGAIQPFARVFYGAGVADGKPHLAAEREPAAPQPLDAAIAECLSACLACTGVSAARP
jgi:sulfite reductase beta subunit-like hemoprotein